MLVSTHQTLWRLRSAADSLIQIFPQQEWVKVAGPGPNFVQQTGDGLFPGMVWEPGSILELACRLRIPEQVGGVTFAGDPLEAQLFSLYPVSLSWNNQPPVFEDEGVVVAAGPALVTVVPRLQAGDNGELRLRIRVPSFQTTQWFVLRFTTPSLRARFELLDTAWAELTMAEAMAVSQEEQAVLQDAAALVPHDLSLFNQAELSKMEMILANLSPRIKQLFVHVISHSHIDMNWLWTWEDTINVILRDFKSVLEIMDDYPELTFSHSQPVTYEVVRQQAPQLFERVLKRIRQGRWEPATMTWVEGDENMASGEALAHQLLEGVSYSREILGFQPSSFLTPDTFGHPANLPQLAVSAGAKRYFHHRCNPGATDPLPAYWWEGQDGTRLLAISRPTYNGDIRARDLVEAALHALKHGHQHSLHFHGVGDHGGGPARHNLDSLRRFQSCPLLPSANCSTLAAYTQSLLDSGVSLPVYRGELNTIFEGCYTTHADIKLNNRAAENLLCIAETLAVLSGLEARESLREAWRLVLFNQFHDLLDGSAIHQSYEKSAVDFAQAKTVANQIIGEALLVLSRGFEDGSILVTNPLGWERSGWVNLPGKKGVGSYRLISDRGHQTVGQYSSEGFGFVARVPAFGTVSYKLAGLVSQDESLKVVPSFAPLDILGVETQVGKREPPYYRVETPFFSVYIRQDSGILTSFLDKRTQRELVHYGMRRGSDYFDTARPDLALNVFQVLKERPHPMSAWHMDEIYSEQSLLEGAISALVETGAARIVLEVKHNLADLAINQKIIFYRDLPQVDFHTCVNWQVQGNPESGVTNLKVAFTASLPEVEAWFEVPFGAVRRPADGQEVPALRWADVGGSEYGIALLNDSKYGYDVLGSRLRLTLLRSAYEPDQIADLGKHEIRFSFLPHPGDWRRADVVRGALGYNQPLLAVESSHSSKASTNPIWLPGVTGSSTILLSGMKLAKEGKGRILRFYESSGMSGEIEVQGIPERATVWETNIVEDKLHALPITDGKLPLAFRPWQLRTILVED